VATKVKVGIIGCGNISNAYFKGCPVFDILEIVGCADIDHSRAVAKAEEHGVKAYAVEDLLADPEIQIVINLTVPQAHAEVSLSIIAAGKHPYSEKPLAIRREDGRKVIEAAKARGVRVGCAPDTFLGAGGQTARKAIEDGLIGVPVAATAFMTGHGPEGWHPNPDFFYQVGGGPMLDMGPYYVTGLVNLLGPARRVTGSARISFPERVITNQARYGEKIKVEIPTHVAGVIDFANGAVATLITSLDVWGAHLPRIEIYGSEGSLSVPDPNRFDGEVQLLRAGKREWETVPAAHSDQVGRGIGVADMAYGIAYDRPHRASGALAFHVLDVMQSFAEASDAGRHVAISSGTSAPAPLPPGLTTGELDR
jgi:predicted dehydrogenase